MGNFMDIGDENKIETRLAYEGINIKYAYPVYDLKKLEQNKNILREVM